MKRLVREFSMTASISLKLARTLYRVSSFGHKYGAVGKAENVHGDIIFDFILRHEKTAKELEGEEKVLSTDFMDFVPQES